MESDFNPNNLTFGFIGLGLIGGSIAKALRNTYNDCTIIGYNRSEKPRVMAQSDGTANIVTDVVDHTFGKCDFIFLCTPVEFNESYLGILSKIIKKDCVVTDVGSVKENIHIAAKKAGIEKNFIGGHPMAGSEKTGYEYSDSAICVDAVYPITPSGFNNSTVLDNYVRLIEAIGFKPIVMSYKTHDFITGAISHLPHLVAAELVLLVKDNEDDRRYMQLLASTGFKDTTRIAASSADMWQQICMTNSENISELLDQYINRLTTLKKAINEKDSDSIYNLFAESKKYRDEF